MDNFTTNNTVLDKENNLSDTEEEAWESYPVNQNAVDEEEVWESYPVNIPSYNIQDIDTGENIIAPATMDIYDARYNQAIQKNGKDKSNFWGKIYQDVNDIGDSIQKKINDLSLGVISGVGGISDTAIHYLYNVPKWQKKLEEAKKSGNISDELLATQMLGYIKGIREKNNKFIDYFNKRLSPKEQRDKIDDFIISVGNASTFTGLSISTAFLTGSPNLTASLMGVLAARMKYTELFDKAVGEGLDYETADIFAEYGSLIEGGIEVVGDKILLNAINATPFKKIVQTAAKNNDNLVKSGRKIVNKKSVLASLVKGAGIEFGEEGAQNVLGELWERAIDESDIDWSDIFEQSLAAAVAGGTGGVVSTSKYNSFIDRFNESFKEQVKTLDSEITEEEVQKISNAGQELLLQVSDSVVEQLDYLASKEIEPDSLPDKNLNMAKRTRDIIKERYNLSDDEIDKIATVATRALNIRNEFNQATQYFYDNLVKAGIEAPQAADVAKVFAAQASANAIAEGISVKEAIDTQAFTFTKVEGEGKITKKELDFLTDFVTEPVYDKKINNYGFENLSEYEDEYNQAVKERNINGEWLSRFGNYSVEEVRKEQIVNDFEKETYARKIAEGKSEKQAIMETMDESITESSNLLNTEDETLFQKDENQKTDKVKGSYNPLTKEIGFTEDADVSTAIHEGMHGFEDNLRQRARGGSKVAEQQINAMKDYVGSDTLDFTREQSEKLARAFERYALDGKAPNKTLKDTFDRFSHWLKSIYNTGEQLGVVSKELNKAFKEMLGGRKLDTALQLGEILMNEQIKEGKVNKAEIGKKISRLLSWTKPRTENGKLVGRFPDKNVNDFFNNTRKILSTTKDKELNKNKKIVAKERIAQNLGDIATLSETGEFALDDGRDIDDLIWENKLLSIVAGTADTSLMAEVYNTLLDTYNEGKIGERVKKEARKQRVENLRNDAKSVILQGKGKDWRKETSKLKQIGRNFGLIYQGWNGLLDTLSVFDKSSKVGESLLNKDFNVFKEENKSRWGVYQDAEKLGSFLTKALGTGKSVSRYVNSTAKEKIKLEWGDNSKTFTRGQLIDLYMKSKDPETRKIMIEDDVLQYNQEFLSRLEEVLTDDDIKVADALFEFYRDNYDKVNSFYENRYGISLGNKEFYSPRSIQSKEIKDIRNGDLVFGVANSSFKQRTAKKGQIKAKDAFAVANDYINSTNHYIAFADKIGELNAVFLGDDVIRNAITSLFGQKTSNIIKGEISRFATNNQKFLDAYDNSLQKIRSNYVVSVLGGRPSITIKQLVSFPAYLEKMSVPEFISGVTEFALNPLKAMKIIGSTEYMKTRGFDINQDFQKISKSEALKKFTTRRGFKDFLMMNVQLGDRGAIYIGGYALYKSELKKNLSKGMSESEAKKKALDTVDEFTNSTQQSPYMSEQSAFQRSALLNVLTLFQTAQNQYLRKELGAIRGLATGRMSLGEAAKIIGIYHFLLPMLFQYISDFGRWDWDNQKRAALLGSFNGAFALSKVLERGADWIVNKKIRDRKLLLRDFVPYASSYEEFERFVSMLFNQDYDDITLEDVSKVLKQGAKAGGMLAGFPAKWFTDMSNIPDYIENKEYGKALGVALGWTPYALKDY